MAPEHERGAYVSFWDDVGTGFPSLKGAASTAYYFECERILHEQFFPALRGRLLLRFMPLPGGAGIGVPIWRMLSPKAVDLEGNGVTPDVPTEMSTDDLDRGVDTQLRRAVELAAQPRAFHEPEPIARVPLWGLARLIPSPGLP